MKKDNYIYEPFYWDLEFTTPKHGYRPFHIAHIYHDKLNIELVGSQVKVNLGRPWFTFLIDAFSRKVLSTYLDFDAPSYRSCMMILKECFHRYGRLPNTLVVDKGKEFNNICFDELLATFSCTKKIRPTKLKSNSVCERLFGLAGANLTDNLQANTQVTGNAASINTNIGKVNSTTWTLGSFYKNLCAWAYEFYDQKEHPTLGKSPREAFNESVLHHRLINYNYHQLSMFNLSTTKSGVATVVPNRGVKINYVYYWHYFLRRQEVENTQIPVRYDSWNLGIAYAYIQGQWINCIPSYYPNFNGRSERFITLISDELRALHKNDPKKFIVTASRIANYLHSNKEQEHIIIERVRDLEVQELLSNLNKSNRDYQNSDSILPTSPDVTNSQQGDLDEEIEPYDEFW